MQASIIKNRVYKILSFIIWILVWEGFSLYLNESLLLPSPWNVLLTLFSLIAEKIFWRSVWFSLFRVALGFITGFILGLLLAIVSDRIHWFEILMDVPVKTIRATPVASIVILILVWIRSRNLSVVISAMIVFPVVYTNILQGLKAEDKKILEMARLYRITPFRRFRYIHLPLLLPYILSSLSISLGLGWKSAIAAEVIGLPRGSIGERLYEAKIYLATPELFAWTVVIVVLAVFFEKFLLFLFKRGAEAITK